MGMVDLWVWLTYVLAFFSKRNICMVCMESLARMAYSLFCVKHTKCSSGCDGLPT